MKRIYQLVEHPDYDLHLLAETDALKAEVARLRGFVVAAVLDWFGPRCAESEAGCATCEAYKLLDQALAPTDKVTP